MSKEKKRPKNLQRLDDYNTLRRETKGFQPKKFPPPEFSVKDNLTYAAKQGVKKAKEVGKKVVDKATDMGSKAGKALKTLQNPTAAEKTPKGKAYGGKIKKMAKGGKLPMVKKDGKMVPAFAADGKGKMADGGKIRNSKPVPMPNPKRSEFKSNMPQLDGEAREKAMREKLKKSTPKRPRYDSKKILDKITGRSASRRIASGGKVKKMAHGGSVGRGDGCAVRGKTKGRMV